MKVKKILSMSVNVILFTLLIAMVFLVIISRASGGEPTLFGHQFKVVLSGSMEPTFQTGSVIAVDSEIDTANLEKGDVITFAESENKLVTHRIIDVVQQGDALMFQTKGDNNENPDQQLVLADNVVAEYTGVTVPYIGYFLDFSNSQMGTALLLIVPGLLLIGYAFFSILGALREIDPKRKEESTPS